MAYFGCNMCIEEGDFINGMTFPGVDAPRRTNESFHSKTNEDYHKGPSPLKRLPIDIISVVSLDYIHVVCHGVVKRLISSSSVVVVMKCARDNSLWQTVYIPGQKGDRFLCF